MGKKRPNGFGIGSQLPGNVVPFERFRRRALFGRFSNPAAEAHSIFYVTDRGDWLSLLESFPFLDVEPIDSLGRLKGNLIGKAPDLILIESNLSWEPPVRLIETLGELSEAPIVMITEASDLRKQPTLLKDAFAVGLHDTLPTPLKRDEVWEALDVLLKFRRESSSTR